METIEIYLANTPLEVEFKVWGEHRPATYYEPAEYQELELISVVSQDLGIDVLEFLSQEKIDEIKEEVINVKRKENETI